MDVHGPQQTQRRPAGSENHGWFDTEKKEGSDNHHSTDRRDDKCEQGEI
jgi:hypothetical protein